MRRKRLTISILDGTRIVLATSDPEVVEATMTALEGRLGRPADRASKAPAEPEANAPQRSTLQ